MKARCLSFNSIRENYKDRFDISMAILEAQRMDMKSIEFDTEYPTDDPGHRQAWVMITQMMIHQQVDGFDWRWKNIGKGNAGSAVVLQLDDYSGIRCEIRADRRRWPIVRVKVTEQPHTRALYEWEGRVSLIPSIPFREIWEGRHGTS